MISRFTNGAIEKSDKIIQSTRIMTSLGAPKVIDYHLRKTSQVIRCQNRITFTRDCVLRPLTLLYPFITEKNIIAIKKERRERKERREYI